MQIKVVNCPDIEFKPYVIRAVEFYGKELIPSKRIYKNLYLEVKFNSKMPVYAFANIENYNASGKAREFKIEIHPWIGAREILSTLAHEMVHVKQYVYGETNDTLSMWKGIPVDSDAVDYYNQPWELEAYGMEAGLFHKFAVQEKLWEVFEDVGDPNRKIDYRKIKWKIQ
jgi:hypothetical protein